MRNAKLHRDSVEYNSYGISISDNAATATTAGSITNFSTARNASTNWLIYGSSGTEGIVEVGRYLDFHGSNTSTEDYTVRLDGGAVAQPPLKLNFQRYTNQFPIGTLAKQLDRNAPSMKNQ